MLLHLPRVACYFVSPILLSLTKAASCMLALQGCGLRFVVHRTILELVISSVLFVSSCDVFALFSDCFSIVSIRSDAICLRLCFCLSAFNSAFRLWDSCSPPQGLPGIFPWGSLRGLELS